VLGVSKYWQSRDMKKSVMVAISSTSKNMAEYQRKDLMGLYGESRWQSQRSTMSEIQGSMIFKW